MQIVMTNYINSPAYMQNKNTFPKSVVQACYYEFVITFQGQYTGGCQEKESSHLKPLHHANICRAMILKRWFT